MNYFFSLLVFIIVLFCYIHIYYHLKTSNDLEIYTVEQPSKDKLEEICNLRQPMMFSYENANIQEHCTFSAIRDKYIAFDLKIRKTDVGEEDALYLPLPIKECDQLFKNDTTRRYFTEKNKDFLEETGVVKKFRHNDAFLRPPLVSNCKYDIWSGSVNTCTPLRYFLNFRNYIYVTDGEISVKLIPPKSSRYLYTEKDYDNFEFRSPINPWDVQKQYLSEFRKVNVLEIKLKKGDMLFIPAYWWYSVRYDQLSSVSVFHYRTYMNTIAILPEIWMSILQQQNTKCETTSKMSLVEKANASVTHFLSKVK